MIKNTVSYVFNTEYGTANLKFAGVKDEFDSEAALDVADTIKENDILITKKGRIVDLKSGKITAADETTLVIE